MKLLRNLNLAIILGIQFVQCSYDPREENGGLDSPDYELEDPFDYFGERNTPKQDTYKPPQKGSDPKKRESDGEFIELVRQNSKSDFFKASIELRNLNISEILKSIWYKSVSKQNSLCIGYQLNFYCLG